MVYDLHFLTGTSELRIERTSEEKTLPDSWLDEQFVLCMYMYTYITEFISLYSMFTD